MSERNSPLQRSDVSPAHVSPLLTPSQTSNNLRASTTTTSPSSRASRWNLSRSASKGWFNKSFDQSTLSKNVSPLKKPIRRQSSMSDFFQSMLTKSRSHLIGLFSGSGKQQRENRTRRSMLDISDHHKTNLGLDECKVDNGFSNQGHSSKINYVENTSNNQLSSPKPSLSSENFACGSDRTSNHSAASGSSEWDISNLKDKPVIKRRSSPAQMFLVSSNNELERRSSLGKTNSPLRHSSQSLNSQKGENTCYRTDEKSESQIESSKNITTKEHKQSNQPHLTHSSSITFSLLDFTDERSEESDNEIEKDNSYKYQQISSAPGGTGRQSLSTEVVYLKTGEEKNKVFTKRALAKSSSDTITKFSTCLAPITKASSDGNCFRAGQTKSEFSLSVMAKITDYLFVGSVESAYNEPLLCKNKITSLIDMTNIQPRVVPLHKKSDCPCPCIKKDHFRSKLNIGVDDIEWENLEQYFKEINTFVDGSRKKKGRTLIFSYIGQSRAPAAVIQYLMHHYKMSYTEAFKIVLSKWPQTKVNPGFNKTLKRLEVNLEEEKKKNTSSNIQTSTSLQSCDASVTELELNDAKKEHVTDIFTPPVVRAAWLEC